MEAVGKQGLEFHKISQAPTCGYVKYVCIYIYRVCNMYYPYIYIFIICNM